MADENDVEVEATDSAADGESTSDEVVDLTSDGDGASARSSPASGAGAIGGLRARALGVGSWFERNLGAEARLARRPSPAEKAVLDAKTPRERSEAERAAVNGLEPREIRIALFAAAFEVIVMALAVGAVLIHGAAPGKHALNKADAWFVLVVGLVLAAGMVLGVLVKRRGLLGFATLLTGMWLLQLAPSLTVIGLAYLGFGIWLVLRALKYTGRKDRAAKASTATGPSGRARGPSSAATGKSARKAAPGSTTAKAPPPNKRYTPPKPPSRRDLARKQAATAASETKKA